MAVDTLIENSEKLSATKGDLFRYKLDVELFSAREEDEW